MIDRVSGEATEVSDPPRPSRGVAQVVVLVLLFLIALAVRVIPAHEAVLLDGEPSWEGVGARVSFRGTDAWLHMRTAEEWLSSFPTRPTWDPLLVHPDGGAPPFAPLFDFMLVSSAWVVGLGSPTSATLDLVGAWLPAVLGSLIVVPIFLLADRVAGAPAGLFAALLVATMPSLLLARSAFAVADHHVAEVFFSSCLLLALHRTAATAAGTESLRSQMLSALGTGGALACYLLTWRSGSPIVVFVILWAVVAATTLADTARRRLLWEVSAAHVAALVAVAPWLGDAGVPRLNGWMLAAGAVISCAVAMWAGLPCRGRWAAALVGLMGMFIGLSVPFVVPFVAPFADGQPLLELTLLIDRLRPEPWAAMVSEMRPWLMDQSLATGLWREFGAPGLLAAGCWLAWSADWVRSRDPRRALLLGWAALVFALSLQQRRFLYYLTVVTALFAGFAVRWLLLRLAESLEGRASGRRVAELGVPVLALAMVMPTLPAALVRSDSLPPPSEDWRSGLRVLAAATTSAATTSRSAITDDSVERLDGGVVSWWDRGHWISALARRAPVANPLGQGAATAASFLLAEDEDTALRIAGSVGARFVVVDDAMPMRPGPGELALGDFASMPVWLDERPERYFERFEIRDASGVWTPLYAFYPGYFRSMVVRLLTFGGEAVERGETTWWVHYRVSRRRDGVLVKRIVRLAPWDDAESRRLGAQPPSVDGAGVALVSLDPTQSCVPLRRLGRLREIGPDASPRVRLFEILDEPGQRMPAVTTSPR